MNDSSDIRRLLANVGAATVSRIGSAALSMVLFWWLARSLDASGLGGFAFCMGVYGLMQAIPLLGLHIPLTREVALHVSDLPALINRHWWFAWPISLLAAIAIDYYSRLAVGAPLHPAMLAVALSMLPTAWTLIAETTLIGQERLRSVAIVTMVESAARLIAAVVAIKLGGGVTAVAWVFLGGRCLAAILYLIGAGLPRPRWLSPPPYAQWSALWAAVPIFLAIVALASLRSRLDVLALSHLVSMAEVAHYAVAAKLYEAALMLPTLVAMVILPGLSRQFRQGDAAFSANVPKAINLIFALGLPLAVIGASIMPWLVRSIFPPELADATPMAQVMLFTAVLATAEMVLSSAMLAAGAQSNDLQALAIGIVVLVLLMFTLSPRIGPLGAAAGMLGQMLISVMWRVRWAVSALGIRKLWWIFARAVIVAALSLAALLFSRVIGAALDKAGAWPIGAIESAAASIAVYVMAALLLGLIQSRQVSNTFRAIPAMLVKRPR